MTHLRIVCTATLMLVGMIATASAGERGASVPDATLAEMGFGKMQPMSDNDGLAVRGKGSHAIVWGTGYGTIVRQHRAFGAGPGVSTGNGFSGGYSKASAR